MRKSRRKQSTEKKFSRNDNSWPHSGRKERLEEPSRTRVPPLRHQYGKEEEVMVVTTTTKEEMRTMTKRIDPSSEINKGIKHRRCIPTPQDPSTLTPREIQTSNQNLYQRMVIQDRPLVPGLQHPRRRKGTPSGTTPRWICSHLVDDAHSRPQTAPNLDPI